MNYSCGPSRPDDARRLQQFAAGIFSVQNCRRVLCQLIGSRSFDGGMYRSPPLSPSRLSNHMTLSPRVLAKRMMTKSASGSEVISCQKGTTAWSLIENAQPESPESLLRLGKRRRTQNSFRDFPENTRCQATADRLAIFVLSWSKHCIF